MTSLRECLEYFQQSYFTWTTISMLNCGPGKHIFFLIWLLNCSLTQLHQYFNFHSTYLRHINSKNLFIFFQRMLSDKAGTFNHCSLKRQKRKRRLRISLSEPYVAGLDIILSCMFTANNEVTAFIYLQQQLALGKTDM